jgi:hypothetical protein
MTMLTTLTRAALRTPSKTRFGFTAIRSAHSGYSGPAVDYDHFSHGWAVGDIEDFTQKSGKYNMQTFNKISPKVNKLQDERTEYTTYDVLPLLLSNFVTRMTREKASHSRLATAAAVAVAASNALHCTGTQKAHTSLLLCYLSLLLCYFNIRVWQNFLRNSTTSILPRKRGAARPTPS